MHDVARLAGVSQSTVSLVVNGDERVASETRERVQNAIAQLGFRANRAARDLRRARSRTLGFVTNQMATSPFAGRTILGAQDAAWRQGHILLVVDAGASPELTDSAIGVLVEQDVGGIIYAPMSPQWVAIPLGLIGVPSILVNSDVIGNEDFPRIEPGDVEGGRIAARALTDAGHRRILFLNGIAGTYTAMRREEGFREVVADFPRGSIELRIAYAGYEISDGYMGMRSVLDEGQWMPTAIFSINDRSALGVIQALTEGGLRVPDDVSLIGYDDQPFLAAYVHPPLSTVVLPHYEMGRLAVEALLEHPGRQPSPGSRNACPRLVIRDSIRKIA